jgi:hypothetical protein
MREDPSVTLVEVTGLPLELAVVREGPAASMQKRLGTRELETGDPDFDEELFVLGPAVPLRAALDLETRRLLVRLFRGQVRADVGRAAAPSVVSSVLLRDGMLQGRVSARMGLSLREDVFGDIGRAFQETARRLALSGDPAPGLSRNAREDPVVQVRLRNLVALAREHPDHAVTKETLRAAAGDRHPEVRLEAGLALGDDGREALIALLDQALLDDGQGARAIEALRGQLPVPLARTVLREALRGSRVLTARAGLDALGRARDPEAIDVLATILRAERGEMAARAARALGTTRESRAERPLLDALEHPDHGARAAAAQALGALGTVAAVPPLRELEARAGEERETRRAAREAVASIQSRLGVSPGRLALATDGAGQVALADDAQGRVSVAPPPGDETR